jgi:dimethylaniline monooxygenase (N-oxide forming)
MLTFNHSLFWAKAGLGTASAPDFWKTMHEGDLTVHRDEIDSLTDKDLVHLKSGNTLRTDMIISCSGYEKPYRPFGEDLRIELGLTYGKDDELKWAKLDAQGEAVVDQKFPILKQITPASTGPAFHDSNLLHGPSRHYRRLVPLSQAVRDDRTILFPGMVHSVFTPLIAEAQALWGSAYLLGQLNIPNEEEMQLEIATFNAWTRKRYLAQGEKHAYAIFDFLSVSSDSDSLLSEQIRS